MFLSDHLQYQLLPEVFWGAPWPLTCGGCSLKLGCCFSVWGFANTCSQFPVRGLAHTKSRFCVGCPLNPWSLLLLLPLKILLFPFLLSLIFASHTNCVHWSLPQAICLRIWALRARQSSRDLQPLSCGFSLFSTGCVGVQPHLQLWLWLKFHQW